MSLKWIKLFSLTVWTIQGISTGVLKPARNPTPWIPTSNPASAETSAYGWWGCSPELPQHSEDRVPRIPIIWWGSGTMGDLIPRRRYFLTTHTNKIQIVFISYKRNEQHRVVLMDIPSSSAQPVSETGDPFLANFCWGRPPTPRLQDVRRCEDVNAAVATIKTKRTIPARRVSGYLIEK